MSVGPDLKDVKMKLLDTDGKYSWIKSPRYDGVPMEVGPLAAIVVGLAAKNPRITTIAEQFFKDTKLSKMKE